MLFGAAIAIAGLVVAVAPELLSGFSASYPAVILIGIVAAVLGVSTITDRFEGGMQADLPEIEGRASVPAPGDGFDERVAGLPRRYTRGSKPDRTRIRQRLEAAAVAAQVRAGLPVELAERRLVTGTWTRNDSAARFFHGGAPSPSGRVSTLLRGEAPFARRAQAAARAVVEIVETGDVPPITDDERDALERGTLLSPLEDDDDTDDDERDQEAVAT